MARPKNINPIIRVRQEDGRWVCQWFAEGRLFRRGCEGATSEEQAREVAKRRFQEWKIPRPPATWTVGELIDQYIRYKTQSHHPSERARSPTFEHNFRQIRAFFAGYGARQLGPDAWIAYRSSRTGMEIVNAGAIAAARNGRASRKVTDATAVRELNALRGALNWAKARNWVGLESFDTKYSMRLTKVQTNPRREYLTRPEFKRLLDALSETPHLELFCLLGVATGARMSALLQLTWDDVTWPGHASKGGSPFSGDFTEEAVDWLISAEVAEVHRSLVSHFEIDMGAAVGNKKRPSGIISSANTRLHKSLQNAWSDHQLRVARKVSWCSNIIAYHGKPIRSVDLSDAFERAGIPAPKRTQHVLKHTCCSWLVQAGHSYAEIADLVGTSAATIERYYGHLDRRRADRIGDTLNA